MIHRQYSTGYIPIGLQEEIPRYKNKQGDIARVAFYMSDRYGVTYSKRQLNTFHQWDK